jgi:hypothetical protein
MTTPDFSKHKLGRSAVSYGPKNLQLARYLLPSLPPAPLAADWTTHLPSGDWGMLGNDAVGDCAEAAIGHMIQSWTAQTGHPANVTAHQIIAAYSAITGYVPGDDRTDNGSMILDVLNYARNHGIAGHKIGAFIQMEPGNVDHVKDAVSMFDGLDIGLNLPITAQRQSVWSVTNLSGPGAPGSWGGHSVSVHKYDSRGLTVVTWGALQRMTWNFFRYYCDEAYAILSPDWITSTGRAPSGFDRATLMADLAALR